MNTVQLTQSRAGVVPSSVGVGAASARIAQSNAAAFVLRPTIVSIRLARPPAGSAAVNVAPSVGPQQQVSLLLNQAAASRSRRRSTSPPRPAPPEADTLAFDVSGIPTGSIPPELVGGQGGSIPPGNYLARVRVDGAESPLEVDSIREFSGPIVTIP